VNKIEIKVIKLIEEYKSMLFLLAITGISLYIRYTGIRFLSADMEYYFVQWYEILKERGGLPGLSRRVGDYNVLYETIIALMTYIDMKAMYLFKMLFIGFDYILAFSVAVFACELRKEKIFSTTFQIVYAIVVLLPTVVLNSAFWGQCDVIYTCFLILFLMFLYKEQWIKAFIVYGIALAFKFQTIFFIPFIIAYYFYKKKFSILLLAVSVSVFYVLSSAGVFFGRHPLEPFYIYLGQANVSTSMYLNVPSFWMLIGDNYEWLKGTAICIFAGLCGVGLYYVLDGKKKMDTAEQYLNTCCWFLWTCILFLPAMHERYTYPLDIIFIILCFLDRKYYKYATISVLLSTRGYASYLFQTDGIMYWQALLYVFAWIHFTYTLLCKDETIVICE